MNHAVWLPAIYRNSYSYIEFSNATALTFQFMWFKGQIILLRTKGTIKYEQIKFMHYQLSVGVLQMEGTC